jgi:hypothetical protein
MALILLGKTTCPLCHRILREGDDIVSTSHFIGDDRDPLWPYSDAGMHMACFLRRELRSGFITRYNDAYRSLVWGNGTYFQMTEDGTIDRIPARAENT